MATAILGVSYCLPSPVQTNDDLRRDNPDWRLDELEGRTGTGIAARHISGEGQTASDLACQAGTALLARGIVERQEIDYVLFCTQCPDQFLPSAACILQERLGLGKHVGALDIDLGCSGFVYGLQLATVLANTGQARNVLLLNADTYTKYIHPRDRSIRPLFGDGAAATLVGPARHGGSIGSFIVGTDGSGAGNLCVPSGGSRLPRSAATARETTDANGCTRSQDNLFMDGPAIFSFATKVVPPLVESLLAKSSLSPGDVNWFVYHQANEYMLERLARRSEIPAAKMIIDVHSTGNTGSPSIPIAIQRAVEMERIRAGQRLVLVGFGVGYSWGACDLVWD
jgi:3-oxoacyl-[acyl-carrier-protein] synthase-3